jgi:hypothetical protein
MDYAHNANPEQITKRGVLWTKQDILRYQEKPAMKI